MVPAVNTNLQTLHCHFFFVYFRIYPIRLIPQTVECFRVWYVEIRITAMATYPMPLASIMLTGILKVSYIVGCFQIGLLLCGIVAWGFHRQPHLCRCSHWWFSKHDFLFLAVCSVPIQRYPFRFFAGKLMGSVSVCWICFLLLYRLICQLYVSI